MGWGGGGGGCRMKRKKEKGNGEGKERAERGAQKNATLDTFRFTKTCPLSRCSHRNPFNSTTGPFLHLLGHSVSGNAPK